MSTTIDQKVVEMRFDNKQFENNVSTTMSTLDKLKQKLNFSGASKGLENIGTTAKKVDLSGIGVAAETIGLKFNAMYTMADQALRNIVTSAMNASERIVKALTIEPIMSGFSEYETQINAIQTILANTESKGTTLNDVNSALDTLNTYADKTIYNFTEMTRNIGTFTAAGIDLDTSVTAIQGIANLAAISGSTSQQASTAMYQLSQALASGTVKLMDWNSVVNAGMGGQVFQDALKETARVHGVAIDDMVKKQGSFRETLQEGWLTSEILTETLAKFTMTTEGLTEAEIAKNKEMLKSKGYTEDQIESIFKLGETATNAATKVKTLTQLWDTLKEAAQSGWTQTWEIMVGDFEESKELFTGISDAIGAVIGNSAEARNTMLEGAMTSNWDKLIDRITEAGIKTEDFNDRVRKVAESKNINLDQLIDKYGSLENVFRSGKLSSDILKEAVKGVCESIKTVSQSVVDLSKVTGTVGIGMKGEDVKQVEDALKSLGYTLIGKDGKDYSGDGYFGTLTRDAIKAFQAAHGLKISGMVDEETLAALKEATSAANELGGSVSNTNVNIDDLVDGITELGGREMLIEALKNVFNGLLSVIKPIKNAFKNVFPPVTSEQLYNFIKGFKDLTENFKLTMPQTRKLYETFKGLFSAIDIGLTFVKELGIGFINLLKNFSGIGDGILDITSSIGNWLTKTRDTVKETDVLGLAIGKVTDFMGKAISKIKEFVNYLKQKFVMPGFEGFKNLMGDVWELIQKVGSKISKVGSTIGDMLSRAFEGGDIQRGLDALNSGLFAVVLLNISKFFKGLRKEGDEGGSIIDTLRGFVDSIVEVFNSLGEAIQSWQQNLKAGTLLKIALAIGILAASVVAVASIEPEKLARSLGAIAVLFTELMASMAAFSAIGGISKGAIGATAVMIGMALAVGQLASAMNKLSTLNWEEIGKGLVGVGGLMAELAIFMKLANFESGMFSAAAGIVVLAAGLKILASVCKDLGGMDWGEIGKGLSGIGGLLAELAVFTHLTNNSANLITTGIGLVAIAGSMHIFASAMKSMAAMSWEELAKGLTGVGLALVAVSVGVVMLPERSMIGLGVGLIAISAALEILADVLDKLGGMSWSELIKGITGIGGAMLMLALGLTSMTGTLAGSAAMIVAVGALALLTPCLKALGNMSWEGIAKGLTAIAGAFAVMGVAGLLLSPLTPVILGLSAALALMGVAALAFGAGVSLISVAFGALATATAAGATAIVGGLAVIVTGIANLIPVVIGKIGEGIIEFCKVIGGSVDAIATAVTQVVTALVGVIVECAPTLAEGALTLISALVDSLATHAPEIVESLANFAIGLLNAFSSKIPELIQAAVNVFATFFSGITTALQGLGTETLVSAITGIGLLAAIMVALGAVSSLVPSALVGVLGVGAVIAELAIVLAAIGALSQIPGLDWLVNEGAGLLESIGNAIGSLVGGIVGGIATGITGQFPQIGTDLSNFMTNAQPFIEGAKTIDASVLEGVNTLASVVMKLTAADLLSGITSFVTGGSSLSDFGTELAAFGPSMKSFADSITGLDANLVTNAANAAQALSDMASKLPNTGGLVSFFTGDNDMATFGANLKTFGADMAAYATSIAGIDTNLITNSANAAQALSDMASTIPNTGGVISFFTGDNDMATFGANLKQFGMDMAAYATSVAGVDANVVTTSANAASALVSLQNSLSPTGGIFAFFTGDNGLDTFGTNLKAFGKDFAEFGTSISGIDANVVTAATNSASALVALQNGLPKEGGWFSGDTTLESFGKEIKGFGTKFNDFYTEISGINTTTLSSVVTSFGDVVSLASGLSSLDFSGVKTFETALKDLGKAGIDGFITAFTDSSERITMTVDTMLMTIANSVSTNTPTITTSFNNLINSMVATFSNNTMSFDMAGQTLVNNLIAGINLVSPNASLAVTTMLTNLIVAMNTKQREFQSAADTLMVKFIAGIKAKDAAVKNTFTSALGGALTAIRNQYTNFYNAGKYLVEGFAAGITANTYLAEARAKAMAAAADAAARRELGINSPSRVGYEIGNFFGMGFINAIHDSVGAVEEASSEMAGGAVDGLNAIVSKISDFVSSDLDVNPTITPVLDLSSVESQAGELNALFTRSRAMSINASMNERLSAKEIQNGSDNVVPGNTYQFTQNNYSPKALSRIEIYRQTKNQFSAMKGLVPQ